MLALYLVFDMLVWKPQREAAMQAGIAQNQESSVIADSTASTQESPVAAAVSNVDSLFQSEQTESKTLSLENDLLKVQFDTKGALIAALELKNFNYDTKSKVNLVPESSSLAGLSVYHGSSSTRLQDIVFDYYEDVPSRSITFYLGSKESPSVQKRFILDDQYGIKMEIAIDHMEAISGLRLDFDAGIADSEKNTKSKAQDYRFYLNADNEMEKLTLAKMRKNPPQGSFNSFAWIAVRSKYFTIAVQEGEPALTRSFSTVVNPETSNPGFSIDSYHTDAKPSWHQSFTLYAGPADAGILKGYGRQMENIAERGANWLRWLANIFAWFLTWLHGYIRNYGVVLIILALLLKIILHPLTHKSMDASLKMQKIQPQVQAIQKKYKDDPKTMQMEMSKLYKEAGANPMSGCLPLLLQMPIFISLYNVLRYSLDMRNAGFALWLKDLSEPDPYMILPITMGAFMVLQSLMMQPKKANLDEMDDKQKAMQSSQKMMTWMMPIMMFFIFRNMPAGLVLYWTTFNIFSVIQQYYLMKHYKNKE